MSPLINPNRSPHPRSVTDLTPQEVTLLTEVLHADQSSSSRRSNERIRVHIQSLPRRLRSKRLSLSSFGITSNGLCDLHKPMNSDLLHHTLGLVYREVTTCFKPFDHYLEHVPATEAVLLDRLRGLKGMWTKPSSNLPTCPNSWAYQVDQCSGCMLARVVSSKEAICDLRAALISRTHVRQNHQPRRLMKFVDECINRYPQQEAEVIFLAASNSAFGLKDARKACTKASGRVGSGGRSHRDPKKRYGRVLSPTDAKKTTSGEKLSPSVDTDIVWAVKSVPRTSGSRYSSPPAHSRGTEHSNASLEEKMNEELTSLHRKIDEQIPYQLKVVRTSTCDEEPTTLESSQSSATEEEEYSELESMDIADMDEERYALFHDNSSFGSLSSSDGEDE